MGKADKPRSGGGFGVVDRGDGGAELMRPIGPSEGQFVEEPMAALVVHINREVLHHGAEIALLRDLYRWQDR